MDNKKHKTAGQPKKFSEPSTTIAIRVPFSKKEHYKRVFKIFVESKEIKQVLEISEINIK